MTSLYAINLVEGEGVGTAYEYFTKLRKLDNFLNTMEKPKRILIAGLPEKYGLSMDFFLIGQRCRAEIVVIDERGSTLEDLRHTLLALKATGQFDDPRVISQKVDRLAEFNDDNWIKEPFDLALSSEVFQRLGNAQGTYITHLRKTAKNFALFAPNGENASHKRFSGLNSVYLLDLLKQCQTSGPITRVFDFGYVDMPPFPPGLSRSQQQRENINKSRFQTTLINSLGIYGCCEHFIPLFIKKKIAHVVYVMAKNRSFSSSKW